MAPLRRVKVLALTAVN